MIDIYYCAIDWLQRIMRRHMRNWPFFMRNYLRIYADCIRICDRWKFLISPSISPFLSFSLSSLIFHLSFSLTFSSSLSLSFFLSIYLSYLSFYLWYKDLWFLYLLKNKLLLPGIPVQREVPALHPRPRLQLSVRHLHRQLHEGPRGNS